MKNQSLRSLAISLAALGILAGPAWSARVVEVRVGEHPTFTRVVFELDAKAGYEIERREVDGGEELVVTLSAASKPRKLSSRSPMVAGVEVESSGKDAVARVRLRRSAPRVKELILASPPRIVLDVMLPEDLARAAAAPKGKAKAKPAAKPETTAKAPSEAEPEAPRVVADAPETPRAEPSKPAPKAKPSAPKAPAVASKATPQPPEVAAAPKPSKPVQPEETKRPQREEATKRPAETGAPTPAPTPPTAAKTPPTPTPATRIETALEGERVVDPKAAEPGEPKVEEPAPPKPLPPVAKPGETAPPKPVAKAPTARAPAETAPTTAKPGPSLFGFRLQGSSPWFTYALVGGAALLFLTVIAWLLRKHSRSTSLDALESARAPIGSEDSFASESMSGGGFGMQHERETYPTAGPGLFDEDSEKGDMDMAAQIPVEREQRGRMTQGSAGADSDPGPLVRELERRLTQLESRLDQANEARERLERQVTAQSEELRVQRAAIARTQRALRGMTRGGEEATEPALRDPSKPPPGRV